MRSVRSCSPRSSCSVLTPTPSYVVCIETPISLPEDVIVWPRPEGADFAVKRAKSQTVKHLTLEPGSILKVHARTELGEREGSGARVWFRSHRDHQRRSPRRGRILRRVARP